MRHPVWAFLAFGTLCAAVVNGDLAVAILMLLALRVLW